MIGSWLQIDFEQWDCSVLQNDNGLAVVWKLLSNNSVGCDMIVAPVKNHAEAS
jgi:hypothetical protein